MSWIYTIVFSGLLFAGRSDMPAMPNLEPVTEPAVAVAAIGDESERFSQTYPLSANGRVNVSNVNGSVTVEGWDRNEVKLEYVKTADTKERLAEVEVRIEASNDSFSVESDYGNRKNGDRWRDMGKIVVDYRLMVPRGAVLDEAETVNGSVTVSGFTNSIKVSAVNGQVSATNIRGTAKVSTVNGDVNADLERVESGSKIALETVNGRVNLTIPSDTSAIIKAESLNGDIRNDFGLPVRKGKYVGRDLYGRIGSGDAQIKLSSVNGSLTVARRNDGRTVSPSTNMLTQKDDDEDWDADAGRAAKLNKEIAAAHRATKESAKAVAKTAPEIAKITTESVERAVQVIKAEDLAKVLAEAGAQQAVLAARVSDAVFTQPAPRIERKSGSFKMKSKPTVTIDAKGCAVSIRGWDKNEVQYRVTQFADPRRSLPLEMSEQHTDTSVTLKVVNPDAAVRGGRFVSDRNRVRIEVFVPERSNLRITSNGQIRVDGVEGDVQVDGEDEAINVRDVEGKLKVSNSDGHIRVIGFRGEIDAATNDGMINLEGDFDKLTARGSEGSITLTLPEDASADLEANCPELVGDGIALQRLSTAESKTRYRIGRGGALYHIETAGDITVRSSRAVSETQ